MRIAFWYVAALVLVLMLPVDVRAESDLHDIWQPLIKRLAADGFSEDRLGVWFQDERIHYSAENMAKKGRSLLRARLARKKGVPSKAAVIEKYVGPVYIAGAFGYWRENARLLATVDERFGVAPEVVVALLLVETNLGTNTGNRSALNTLANMALTANRTLLGDRLDVTGADAATLDWLDSRLQQKADWAYRELKALIEYAVALDQNPVDIPGSVFGAIGLCQFMPTNAKHYGVDGNADNRVDLFVRKDALSSMANFLKEHGWRNDLSSKEKLKVVYRYNHSESYALTVMEVAERLRRTNEFFGWD